MVLNFQPEAGSFVAFDHITFWVGNAKQVSINDTNTKKLVYSKFVNKQSSPDLTMYV